MVPLQVDAAVRLGKDSLNTNAHDQAAQRRHQPHGACVRVHPFAGRSHADRSFRAGGAHRSVGTHVLRRIAGRSKANDTIRIADLIEYPVRVNGPGRPRAVTRAQFLAKPDAVLTDRIRRQVLAQQFDDLFVNAEGVMFGSGELWFSGVCDKDSPAGQCRGERVRVTSVNLGPAK